jgi:DNA polymerase III gamma/tau subunit
MTDTERWSHQAQLSTAFQPSSPVDKYDLFAGRRSQTDQVINAILQRGQHVMLYGERGVGKTSLARVLSELLSKAGIKTVNSDTINCDPTDDFSSLWHKALRQLTFKISQAPLGFSGIAEKETHLDGLVGAKITPDEVRMALSTLTQKSVIIFDEFDKLEDKKVRTLMANTIKNLSDHGINTTLVLIGVAQSVTDLIQEHQSIDRALIQVPMPRMDRDELLQIIQKSLLSTQFKMDDTVVQNIVGMSYGLPHYTHLLSLESGMAALERLSSDIGPEDFTSAVHRIVNSKQTISEAYRNAVVSSHKTSKHRMTFLACAIAPPDQHGYFQAASVAQAMASLLQKECSVSDIQKHLTEFASPNRGNVLQKTGTIRRYRYRFSDPMLQPYTIIHSLHEGLISESQLWTYKPSFEPFNS